MIRARDKLQRSNVRILGVLINNLADDEPGYGKYYSYYGTPYGEKSPREARTAAGS